VAGCGGVGGGRGNGVGGVGWDTRPWWGVCEGIFEFHQVAFKIGYHLMQFKKIRIPLGGTLEYYGCCCYMRLKQNLIPLCDI